MTLHQLADSGPAVPIRDFALNLPFAREVQTRLAACGLLDPPADGFFGPVSEWALDAFRLLAFGDREGDEEIDRRTARALLHFDADRLAPLDTRGDDLASRLARHLQRLGHWFCRAPGAVTIVYVEGMDPDGRFNEDEPDQFNDARFVLSMDRRPAIEGAWEATTEPGAHYTNTPMNPRGAARIAFGQHKAWTVGVHGARSRDPHEALIQNAEICVHRDRNRDFERTGDAVEVGAGFGLNQHWGYDNPRSRIGRASAGCLVGRTRAGHRDFMRLAKADPRYRASRAYRFQATVLDGRVLQQALLEEQAALQRVEGQPLEGQPLADLPGRAPARPAADALGGRV